MKIVVAGGTGFVGQALCERLIEQGHQLVVLTRRTPAPASPAERSQSITFACWDALHPGDWTFHLEGASAVINLTGESVAARRWTSGQKNLIVNSRMDSTRALVQALRRSCSGPEVLINASAVGYYGDTGEREVTEETPGGQGFLADVCKQWEDEARTAETFGVRVVRARFGMILDREGGALARMLPSFRWFLGGVLGHGRQWVSWIHRDDVIGAIQFILQRKEIRGAVNLTSPNPVRMSDFCCSMGAVLKRPVWFHVPSFVLEQLMGEMSNMLLTGQRVLPAVLENAGYVYRHPQLFETLSAVLK